MDLATGHGDTPDAYLCDRRVGGGHSYPIPAMLPLSFFSTPIPTVVLTNYYSFIIHLNSTAFSLHNKIACVHVFSKNKKAFHFPPYCHIITMC